MTLESKQEEVPKDAELDSPKVDEERGLDEDKKQLKKLRRKLKKAQDKLKRMERREQRKEKKKENGDVNVDEEDGQKQGEVRGPEEKKEERDNDQNEKIKLRKMGKNERKAVKKVKKNWEKCLAKILGSGQPKDPARKAVKTSCRCLRVHRGFDAESVTQWFDHSKKCPYQDQSLVLMTDREERRFEKLRGTLEYKMLCRRTSELCSKDGLSSDEAFARAWTQLKEDRAAAIKEEEEERRLKAKAKALALAKAKEKAAARMKEKVPDGKENIPTPSKVKLDIQKISAPSNKTVIAGTPKGVLSVGLKSKPRGEPKLMQPTLSIYAKFTQKRGIKTKPLAPLRSRFEEKKEVEPKPLATVEDICNSFALYFAFLKTPEDYLGFVKRVEDWVKKGAEEDSDIPKLQKRNPKDPEHWPEEGYSWLEGDAEKVRYRVQFMPEVEEIISDQGMFRIEVGEFGIHACYHYNIANAPTVAHTHHTLRLYTFDVNGFKGELYDAKGGKEFGTMEALADRIKNLRYGSIFMIGGQCTRDMVRDFKTYVQPRLYECGHTSGNFADVGMAQTRLVLYGAKGALPRTGQFQARPQGCYIYRHPNDASSILDGPLGRREGLCPKCCNFRGCGIRRGVKDENIVIPSGEITWDHMFEQLEKIGFPHSDSRKNVMSEHLNFLECFCLGVVNCYSVGPVVSTMTHRMPKLTKLITEKFRRDNPDKALAAPHSFSVIQVNRNVETKLHVDGNNVGPSYICTFGKYTGGETWMYDGVGTTEIKVEQPLRGYPELKVGTKIRGTAYDVKNKWTYFNGRNPHYTMPFEGKRYALVYFVHNCMPRLKSDTIFNQLLEFGFQLDPIKYKSKSDMITDDDLKHFDENPDLMHGELEINNDPHASTSSSEDDEDSHNDTNDERSSAISHVDVDDESRKAKRMKKDEEVICIDDEEEEEVKLKAKARAPKTKGKVVTAPGSTKTRKHDTSTRLDLGENRCGKKLKISNDENENKNADNIAMTTTTNVVKLETKNLIQTADRAIESGAVHLSDVEELKKKIEAQLAQLAAMT